MTAVIAQRLSAQQLLDIEQGVALDSAFAQSLSNSVFIGLNPDQRAALLTHNLVHLSSSIIANISSGELSAIYQRLSNAQITAITSVQFQGLSASNAAACTWLLNNRASNLSADVVQGITSAQLTFSLKVSGAPTTMPTYQAQALANV